MTKLPSIYREEQKNFKQHNKTTCYVINKEKIEDQIDIVFSDKEPKYMKKVFIETDKKTYNTRIKEKNKDELITINNEIIPITDIKYIKRIS